MTSREKKIVLPPTCDNKKRPKSRSLQEYIGRAYKTKILFMQWLGFTLKIHIKNRPERI